MTPSLNIAAIQEITRTIEIEYTSHFKGTISNVYFWVYRIAGVGAFERELGAARMKGLGGIDDVGIGDLNYLIGMVQSDLKTDPKITDPDQKEWMIEALEDIRTRLNKAAGGCGGVVE